MTSKKPNEPQTIGFTLLLLFVVVNCLGQQTQSFVTSIYQSAASGWKPDTLDRGIGILFFTNRPGHGLRDRPDTIIAFAKPQKASNIVGFFILAGDNNGWTYHIASRYHLQPNVLGFDYEECGVPFDTMLASNHWARAVLGFRRDGQPLRGWVRIDTTTVRFKHWSQELPQHLVFFLPDVKAQFWDRPNGKTISWDVTSAPYNYIMHPLDVRAPWLKVRVTRPQDIYVGTEQSQSDTLYAWIRYLNGSGRPTIWYYTRD